MPTPARSAAPRADALPEAGIRGTLLDADGKIDNVT
jgi:hypothetical protein